MQVELRAFVATDLARLSVWLRTPHVARWYPAPDENLAWASSPPEGAEQAIVVRDGADVGYLRWQRVSRETLDELGLQEVPANSVDADILIGELENTARGTGVAALRALIEVLKSDHSVPLIGLTTEVANLSAHRAFERAGFVKARQYVPPTLGPCYLMLHDLHAAST